MFSVMRRVALRLERQICDTQWTLLEYASDVKIIARADAHAAQGPSRVSAISFEVGNDYNITKLYC